MPHQPRPHPIVKALNAAWSRMHVFAATHPALLSVAYRLLS